MTLFNHAQAKIYDEIKDYNREYDAIEKIFAKFNANKTKSILDIGCGTGSHALISSNRNYEVTGIDT